MCNCRRAQLLWPRLVDSMHLAGCMPHVTKSTAPNPRHSLKPSQESQKQGTPTRPSKHHTSRTTCKAQAKRMHVKQLNSARVVREQAGASLWYAALLQHSQSNTDTHTYPSCSTRISACDAQGSTATMRSQTCTECVVQRPNKQLLAQTQQRAHVQLCCQMAVCMRGPAATNNSGCIAAATLTPLHMLCQSALCTGCIPLLNCNDAWQCCCTAMLQLLHAQPALLLILLLC